MLRLSRRVVVCLFVLCGSLWGQPTFRWPAGRAGVRNFTGTLGEPRTNPRDATDYLHHWPKGLGIPKTNGDTILVVDLSDSIGIFHSLSLSLALRPPPTCKEEPHGCVYTKNAYPISLFR